MIAGGVMSTLPGKLWTRFAFAFTLGIKPAVDAASTTTSTAASFTVWLLGVGGYTLLLTLVSFLACAHCVIVSDACALAHNHITPSGGGKLISSWRWRHRIVGAPLRARWWSRRSRNVHNLGKHLLNIKAPRNARISSKLPVVGIDIFDTLRNSYCVRARGGGVLLSRH